MDNSPDYMIRSIPDHHASIPNPGDSVRISTLLFILCESFTSTGSLTHLAQLQSLSSSAYDIVTLFLFHRVILRSKTVASILWIAGDVVTSGWKSDA